MTKILQKQDFSLLLIWFQSYKNSPKFIERFSSSFKKFLGSFDLVLTEINQPITATNFKTQLAPLRLDQSAQTTSDP